MKDKWPQWKLIHIRQWNQGINTGSHITQKYVAQKYSSTSLTESHSDLHKIFWGWEMNPEQRVRCRTDNLVVDDDDTDQLIRVRKFCDVRELLLHDLSDLVFQSRNPGRTRSLIKLTLCQNESSHKFFHCESRKMNCTIAQLFVIEIQLDEEKMFRKKFKKSTRKRQKYDHFWPDSSLNISTRHICVLFQKFSSNYFAFYKVSAEFLC